MAVFRNVMVYLGLGPDEEYEDGYLHEEDPAPEAEVPEPARRAGGFATVGAHDAVPRPPAVDEYATGSAVGAVRPLRSVDAQADDVLDLTTSASDGYIDDSGRGVVKRVPVATGAGSETVRMAGRDPMNDRSFGSDSGGLGTSRVEPVVRAVPIQRTKPLAIVPETFADAKTIGDEFKRSVPVIMNLQGLDRELARRLIDFASGVCYSLNGSMDKIASQVFLLTPDSVEISEEDMRRIEERGYAR